MTPHQYAETRAGRYVSKPVEVEAIRWWAGTNDAAVKEFSVASASYRWQRRDGDDGPYSQVFDYLHDTWVGVFDGQWIIRGTKGELYPCDDEVFRQKYAPAHQFDGSSDG